MLNSSHGKTRHIGKIFIVTWSQRRPGRTPEYTYSHEVRIE